MKDQLRDYSLNKPSLICRSHILANATGYHLFWYFLLRAHSKSAKAAGKQLAKKRPEKGLKKV